MSALARSSNATLSDAASRALRDMEGRGGAGAGGLVLRFERELAYLIRRAEALGFSESRWELLADLYNGLVAEVNEIVHEEARKPRSQRRLRARILDTATNYTRRRDNVLSLR